MMQGDRYREIVAGVGIDPKEIEESELLVAHLEWVAERARSDVKEFFGFVMREEHTNAELVIAPHQRVLFDFVEAHRFCVVRMPVGTSKTFCMATLGLHFLGRDPASRGALVSATQGQAMKPLAMVRDLIEASHELRLVFPRLRKSVRKTDPWTQTEITVDRPPAIRDPSLVAVGIDGAIAGSRLSWAVVDDILDRENTSTTAGLHKVHEWFDSSVLSRIDPHKGRLVVTNTPWSPDDITYRLEAAGWPTLTMDIEGNIKLTNCPDWDSSDIVPSARPGEVYRLTAHNEARNERGEVITENVPLWPERYDWDEIERLRTKHLPHRYNQLYMCICRNDETARCKIDWIERCKEQGKGRTLVSEYTGSNVTVTGVDLAVGKGAQHDLTALFTAECLPDGKRLILDVEFGQWDAPTIVRKIIEKCERYKSIARVENNSCFVPGTRVLTKNGYVPIELVTPGTEVWTHRGRWRRVVERVDGIAHAVCTARAHGSLPVVTTPNHWFWLREAEHDGLEYRRPVGEATWISLGLRDRPAYAGLAVPRWPAAEPVLHVGSVDVSVGEREALLLGLFIARGEVVDHQVRFIFGRHESHLAEFVRSVLYDITRNVSCERIDDFVFRVDDAAIADMFGAFGVGDAKCPPIPLFGWPLAQRLAMVRGWLMGAGCMRSTNMLLHEISGISISRNWVLFARTTLFEFGCRAMLTMENESSYRYIKPGVIDRSIYTLSLYADDAFRLCETFTSEIEDVQWAPYVTRKHASNSKFAIDDKGVWASILQPEPGAVEKYDGPVYNLIVEEDESYVVEDYIVHNAQDYILQFARAQNASVPIKAHTTGRNKAHPEYGVESLFVEIQNGAWIIPCDHAGRCHPNVQRWVDACLYYQPDAHVDDVLMASWLAREQARAMGLTAGVPHAAGARELRPGLAASLMAR